MRALPFPAQAYIGLAVAAAVVLAATAPLHQLDAPTVAVLAILVVVCESAPARLRVDGARVSPAFAASLASVVLLGPAGAALVSAAAIAAARRFLTPVKRLFNGAQFMVAGYLAGVVYTRLGGTCHHPGEQEWLACAIGPFLAAAATFVAVNLLLLAVLLLLGKQAPPRELAREMLPLATTCLALSLFGLLIAGLWPVLGLLSPALVLVPLLVARWALAQTREQQRAYDATLAALCQAVETKDYITRGHSERVARGSVMLANELGMPARKVRAVRYAGMLHDVGKLGVPTAILQKAGPMTDDEYAVLQRHPVCGLEIVGDIEFLDEARAGIMHHHERIDGRGYPTGLAGTEIPEFARLICVVDAFDTMTSTRPYQKPRPAEQAIQELRKHAGTQFDAAMVRAFVQAYEREGWEHPPAPPTAADNSAHRLKECPLSRNDRSDRGRHPSK